MVGVCPGASATVGASRTGPRMQPRIELQTSAYVRCSWDPAQIHEEKITERRVRREQRVAPDTEGLLTCPRSPPPEQGEAQGWVQGGEGQGEEDAEYRWVRHKLQLERQVLEADWSLRDGSGVELPVE